MSSKPRGHKGRSDKRDRHRGSKSPAPRVEPAKKISTILDRPRLAQEGARPEDGVQDMTILSDLDEIGININLRTRYYNDLIYTYTGTILIAVNPYRHLGIYEQEIIRRYSGKKMTEVPPHIFATAESAYYYLEHSDRNQSCIISGESGAGKTESTKFILQYLCAVTQSVARWVEQQILEANTILEAFGNAKTLRNDNSSRFGKFIQVCFDAKGQISGSVIQDYLLEQSRITFQAREERNYHVFYQLCAGANASPELKKKFLMVRPQSFSFINQSGCYELEEVDDRKMFEDLCLAMNVLNISEELRDGLFQTVSAILWLGNVSFEDLDGESCAIKKVSLVALDNAASLLGIPPKQLRYLAVNRQITVKGSVTEIPLKLHEAYENRNAMAKALYTRSFTWLVRHINSCTNPGVEKNKFIGVLDIFGFENFEINSFEQMCINYTNEKLHKFFNHYVFKLEQEIYEEEGIDFSHIEFTDNTICLELIEKPPKCLLKLLDEECRFPKGTDQSFIEKITRELGDHQHFIKSPDNRLVQVEFGIQHYAGEVIYQVEAFLDKNKDVQQGSLFELMLSAVNPFVRDVTKYQNMLESSLELARNQAVNKHIFGPNSGTKSGKGKPTVGDTFRQQLASLNDVLDTTNPWYVRCLKPNHSKAGRSYDDQLIVTQLRYSGMLDIVRIRKQGFPVHVPAPIFLDKYRCLAVLLDLVLPPDPREATRAILRALKLPETEWQIGRTKVFLRNTVFDPLEKKRREIISHQILIIQRYWKGFAARKKYLRTRQSIIRLQRAWRARKERFAFLRKREATIVIQSYVRGMFARELATEMRKRRKKEELDAKKRKRKQKEREEKDEKEREKLVKLERELLQEKEKEQLLTAEMDTERQLYSMARLAELKAERLKRGQPAADLDLMFESLEKGDTAREQEYLEQINRELEQLFMESQQQTPERQEGGRTVRRKRRVQKKMLGIAEEEEQRRAEEIDPAQFSMLQFADRFFNDHPKGSLSGSISIRKSSITKRSLDDILPKSDMLRFARSPTIPTSLIHMHDPENVHLACNIFRDLNKLIRGELRPEQVNLTIQSIIAYGIDRHELRDEIFCQLVRQSSESPKDDWLIKAWQFTSLCIVAFPPSRHLSKFLLAFFSQHQNQPMIGRYAQWCYNVMRITKASPRKLPPSSIEINRVRELSPLILRFYFLDGKAKAIGVDPCCTAADVVQALAEKIDLQSVDGWALYEVNPEYEHFVKGHEYIADILAQWERDKRSSIEMTKYATVSKKGHTQAMGGGDSKFVFRKRVFKNPKVIPQDPVEYHLMYAQAVNSVVQLDEFAVSEKVALQLAGLQAQVLWGEFDSKSLSRYSDVSSYLPSRILTENRRMSEEEWKGALAGAHKQYGSGKTEIQAKVWYLTSVHHYPLYGSTQFPAHYKGFWSHPNNLILTVSVEGVCFVNQKSKQVMASYDYVKLDFLTVDQFDPIITLHMKVLTPEEQKSFIFETTQKEDIANLIASYSPSHTNWQRVGDAPSRKKNRATDEERYLLYLELRKCRKALFDSNMLRRPLDSSGGFLTTTLRRYNRAKLARLQAEREEKDFEKIFKQSYWSYSKSRLSQPMTNLEGDEQEDSALRMFQSLLFYAGLASSPGLETDDGSPESLVQLVIAKCLEKEALCNEFYTQLIKQSTDQPDPNSRINVQNWRFLSLTCGVVVPRSKSLLNYLWAHLKFCALESNTEEGKYAQYCMRSLQRTIQNKNRKYPPSIQEIVCVVNRSKPVFKNPIHTRFYFMDGQFRALEFDAAANVEEVVELVKDRIGLRPTAAGFSVFEVFGQLERNMLPQEKVADAIFKWEKYAKTTRSQKELRLTFKKRLFLKPYANPTDSVEFNLIIFQVIDDIFNDKFPLSYEEAVYLTALRAHVELGEFQDNHYMDYESIVDRFLPKHMRSRLQASDVARKHRELRGMDSSESNDVFLNFVQQWALYGSTIFEVTQSYTLTLPKNLWLAVNQDGVHILKRRDKESLVFYDYRSIVNYSPSLKNLMLVTESLTRGTKFVFNTAQASQIAHLIRDYTHIIVERQRRAGASLFRSNTQENLLSLASAQVPSLPPDSIQKSLI